MHECTSPPVRERKVRQPEAPLSPLQKNWRRRHAESRWLAAKTVLSPPTLRGESREARKEASSTVRFQAVQNIPRAEGHTVQLYSNTKVTRAQLREQRQSSLRKPQKHRLRRNPWQNPYCAKKKNRNTHLRIDQRVWSARPLVQQTNKDRVAAI